MCSTFELHLHSSYEIGNIICSGYVLAFHLCIFLAWMKHTIWVRLSLGVFTPWWREQCVFGDTRHWQQAFSLCWQLRRAGSLPEVLRLWAWAAGLQPASLWNVVLSLGPSMAVRIALVLILSTSFVIQKNARSTLRTSGPSSASSVTLTLNTRTPNTTGCRMNILTVSRHRSWSCCADGHFAFQLRWHQALALLSSLW